MTLTSKWTKFVVGIAYCPATCPCRGLCCTYVTNHETWTAVIAIKTNYWLHKKELNKGYLHNLLLRSISGSILILLNSYPIGPFRIIMTYLWQMDNLGNLFDFTVPNVRIFVEML